MAKITTKNERKLVLFWKSKFQILMWLKTEAILTWRYLFSQLQLVLTKLSNKVGHFECHSIKEWVYCWQTSVAYGMALLRENSRSNNRLQQKQKMIQHSEIWFNGVDIGTNLKWRSDSAFSFGCATFQNREHHLGNYCSIHLMQSATCESSNTI